MLDSSKETKTPQHLPLSLIRLTSRNHLTSQLTVLRRIDLRFACRRFPPVGRFKIHQILRGSDPQCGRSNVESRSNTGVTVDNQIQESIAMEQHRLIVTKVQGEDLQGRKLDWISGGTKHGLQDLRVRAHDSNHSLKSLNLSKHEGSNHGSTRHSGHLALDGNLDMTVNDDSSHGPRLSRSTYSNSSSVHSAVSSSFRDSPTEKSIHRNRSFGDIHRFKQAVKRHIPRNFSHGEIRKHRHLEPHSVSKRFQQILGRSESFREAREVKEITFKKDFLTHYSCDLYHPLSHGRYGYVTAALSCLTRENFAVKIIHKDKLFDKKTGRRCDGENVRVEVLALKNLANQPNVVKFVDVFEDEMFFYLVMELCRGGNLLERINRLKNMKEAQAGPLLKQMLAVTNVCHAQGIAHRDLKLENFVFLSATEDYPLKLVDFGSAAFFRNGNSRPFKGVAGTFNYMAPEVFDHSYGPIADVWSLGVVAYSMLCGTLPFNGDNIEDLKRKILHEEVEFSHPAWDDVSESAKDLLRKMLEKNPDYRITVDEALSHSWFNERGASPGSNRGVCRTQEGDLMTIGG
ncbi:hypothetical protein R1flu_015320 [Riccia fluitans]|uniref:Protein kinase domain-containing protein n=1 Tax=Riccia fluitans TaxID=41844 RepID=A0ABD1YIM4_9MARC